ncbi:unnamed protein product [Closterium sp. Naga37s-1]|nr:unnamed protein product [Closterium sp. Naga37s-1]
MLVYIRQSDQEKILCSNDVNGIAQPLQVIFYTLSVLCLGWTLLLFPARFGALQHTSLDFPCTPWLSASPLAQDRLKRKREEEDQLTEVKVARDEDLRQQIGGNVYLNLVDHALVRSFRVKKQMRFPEFKADVEKEMGIPVARQRFWVWGKRWSEMYRLNQHLSAEEEEMTVSREDGDTWKVRTQDDIVVFVKLYDPMHSTIRYAGHLIVKPTNKPADVLKRIKEFCPFYPLPHSCALPFFFLIHLPYIRSSSSPFPLPERNFGTDVECDPIDNTTNFKDMQLEAGAILCVQKALTAAQKRIVKHPDVPSFLEFVQTQQVVHFRRLEKPRDDAFCLLL